MKIGTRVQLANFSEGPALTGEIRGTATFFDEEDGEIQRHYLVLLDERFRGYVQVDQRFRGYPQGEASNYVRVLTVHEDSIKEF